MRRGFSLIEIMVVMTIVVVLFAISFSSLRGEQSDSEVQAEAERLGAVLRQTRNRAIAERAAYGVVFNLRNGVGTSGEVLNNWDGGHWYRVIGPGRGSNPHALPIAGPGEPASRNLPDFMENVAASWVSPPHALPLREVRFLALGDTDEGNRRNGASAASGDNRYYASTYPRPWFGLYQSGRLWAWGGYDPSKDHSAFYYEGADGDVTGSVNPSTRSYDNDFDRDGSFSNVDHNGDSDFDDPGERERGYVIWEAGEGRPVVDARFMDACIMFTPSGEAQFLEWNRARRAYVNQQAVPGSDTQAAARNGIADRAKTKSSTVSYDGDYADWVYTGPRHLDVEDHGEVGHFTPHTGGWHITLAPDATQDDNRYPDAERALDSITPAWRVFVGSKGAVRVFRVQRRGPSFLGQGTVFPSSPSGWNDTNLMWRRCRLGWLHANESDANELNLVPEGEPIVHLITERMLTDRIWWFQP